MDWVEMLTGAGLLASGLGYGYLLGRRNKRPPKPIPEICQCHHPSSMHDKNGCLATQSVESKWNRDGDPIGWEGEPCPCIRYVGPHSSYVPELEGEPRENV